MLTKEQPNKYHKSIRVLHWSMSMLIFTLILVGAYMTELSVEDGKYNVYMWHKAFGVLILLLISLRIWARLSYTIPSSVKEFTPIINKISSIVHLALYGLMIVTPLTGFLMSMLGGHSIWFFGWTIPQFLPIDKDLAGIPYNLHGVFAYSLGALALIHASAVGWHLFIDKYNILKRII